MPKALLVFAGGAVVTALFARLVLEFQHSTAGLWFSAFYVGHAILALLLTAGRMRLCMPVNLAWVDLLVVAGVPWVGAVAWYCEWRKVNN
jgi:hypothetical protein